MTISSISFGVRLVTFRGCFDLLSFQASSSLRRRSTHLYSQDFERPREAQIDSGFSPLRNRCTANIRCCVISSFMNTPRMVSVFIEIRDSYSIITELCPRCYGTLFRPRCPSTQQLELKNVNRERSYRYPENVSMLHITRPIASSSNSNLPSSEATFPGSSRSRSNVLHMPSISGKDR